MRVRDPAFKEMNTVKWISHWLFHFMPVRDRYCDHSGTRTGTEHLSWSGKLRMPQPTVDQFRLMGSAVLAERSLSSRIYRSKGKG